MKSIILALCLCCCGLVCYSSLQPVVAARQMFTDQYLAVAKGQEFKIVYPIEYRRIGTNTGIFFGSESIISNGTRVYKVLTCRALRPGIEFVRFVGPSVVTITVSIQR